MQRVTGYMRKAITEFQMIENGDRIAVGVSRRQGLCRASDRTASAATLYWNRL